MFIFLLKAEIPRNNRPRGRINSIEFSEQSYHDNSEVFTQPSITDEPTYPDQATKTG